MKNVLKVIYGKLLKRENTIFSWIMLKDATCAQAYIGAAIKLVQNSPDGTEALYSRRFFMLVSNRCCYAIYY